MLGRQGWLLGCVGVGCVWGCGGVCVGVYRGGWVWGVSRVSVGG